MPEYEFNVVANQPHPKEDASIVTLSAKQSPANPTLGTRKPSADLRMTIHDKDEASQFQVGDACTISINTRQSAKPSEPSGTGVSTT